MQATMNVTSRTITVAAGQVVARLMNEAQDTLASIESIIRQAADQKAQLLVLPECAYPAYLLGSVASYRAGEHMTGQMFVDWLCERAERHRMHIVSGFVEDDGTNLYNAAVLIDDQGREVGRARKHFLWNVDRDWFIPGDRLNVFDTQLGRIGITICAEMRAPEILATLAARGAELIAMPTCWINTARNPGRYENPQVSFLIEARAREFGLPIICADKSGLEMPGVGYVGMSRIVRAGGSLAVEAPPTGEAVVCADITLGKAYPTTMSTRCRDRILSPKPPIRPNVDKPRPITVVALSTGVAEQCFAEKKIEALFELLTGQGVNVIFVPTSREEVAEAFVTLAKRHDIHAVTSRNATDVFSLGPGRFGCVSGRAVRSFAACRAMALEGAELLFCFDGPDDIALLQTRAMENRVFLVGASTKSALIVDSSGKILARTGSGQPGEVLARIDLADTGNKLVAPRTDIFDERRVALYSF